MKKMDIIIDNTLAYEKTLDLRKILQKKVISKNGLFVGKVKELRMSEDGLRLEGVLIKRGIFKRKLYLGKKYIDRLTYDSIILNADPFLLLKGIKVITSEGEVVGRVKDFVRKSLSNDIEQLTVGSLMRGKFNIPVSYVKSRGYSIILKPN